MKLLPVPQNLMEWIGLKADLVPVPLAHTQICFMLSRAVLDAHSLGVFEIFKNGKKNLDQASFELKMNPRALRSLLNVLISTGYFHFSDGYYRLTKHARKWCLKDSPHSLYNLQLFNNVCWDWMSHLETFLKTGNGLQYHENFNEREWELYQKGMESIAGNTTKAAVKMAPKFIKPEKMLDIGGSHGLYSIEFCKEYPTLHSIILDLPEAVKKAEPILKSNYSGDNIGYLSGNALIDDFGKNKYDFILMSSLMHHFTEEQNILVCKKVKEALKVDGYFIIQEFIRPEPSANMEMVGTILDLFFNLSSTSGNWSKEELIAFQQRAGLKYIRMKKFIMAPGFVQIISRK